MRWLIAVFVSTLAATSAAAEIYRWVLPDGSVEYSDRPPVEGAERVDLRPLITYTPSPASSSPATPAEESVEEGDVYTSFAIASPADEAAIRDNAGNITLSFALSPALAEGHVIDIFIDGSKYGRSSATVFTLSNVNRGSHRIYATIVDDSGAEQARTGTITVHLKRASSLF